MVLTEQIVLDAIEFGMLEWSQFDWNNATFSAKQLESRNVCFRYDGTNEPRFADESYPKWCAQVIGDRFYLLWILLPTRMRCQGHGSSLYSVIERIAAALGCSEIWQTPSGWTPKGDTRRSYLHRRGWLDDVAHVEVFKRLEVIGG